MVFIFCALYCEAHPIIERLELKRESHVKYCEVYVNREQGIFLFISGVGALKTASTVSYALARYCCDDEQTIVLNVGTCAGRQELQGNTWLINKITDSATGYTYYPDMLINLLNTDMAHGEKEIRTVYKPVLPAEVQENSEVLFDMEASGFFEAASNYLSPDRIVLIKCVSDAGSADDITPKILTHTIESNLEHILAVVGRLKIVSEAKDTPYDKTEFEIWVNEASEKLCCTEAMFNELRQLLKYAALNGGNLAEVIGQIPICRNKREGSKVLDELGSKLI